MMRTAILCVLATTVLAAQEPIERRLEQAREVMGQIEAHDAMREDNSHYQDWTFTAAAGAQVVITLRSGAFDAFLDLGRYDANYKWQSLATDDDSGGGRDAKLTYVVPEAGDYVVRVITYNSLRTGPYTLLLQVD
jgi:hypothetical protein